MDSYNTRSFVFGFFPFTATSSGLLCVVMYTRRPSAVCSDILQVTSCPPCPSTETCLTRRSRLVRVSCDNSRARPQSFKRCEGWAEGGKGGEKEDVQLVLLLSWVSTRQALKDISKGMASGRMHRWGGHALENVWTYDRSSSFTCCCDLAVNVYHSDVLHTYRAWSIFLKSSFFFPTTVFYASFSQYNF